MHAIHLTDEFGGVHLIISSSENNVKNIAEDAKMERTGGSVGLPWKIKTLHLELMMED